jgi:sigma-B regulation protein RsbU (phosphoserine phosphatase)
MTPRLLIIDDSPVDSRILAGILANEGFKAAIAASGSEGFNAAIATHPDIILLDVMMPGESGFDTCRRLKQNPETAQIPIIFLTAAEDVESRVSGLTIGAVDYITKPFQREELIARIRVHLRIRDSFAEVHRNKGVARSTVSEPTTTVRVSPSQLPGAKFAIYGNPDTEAKSAFYDVACMSTSTYCYFTAEIHDGTFAEFGISAALTTVIQQNTKTHHAPIETMVLLNGVLRSVIGDTNPVSACIAQLNRVTRILTLVSAGCAPVLWLRARGKPEFIVTKGGPLCTSQDPMFETRTVRLEGGDRLLFYTRTAIQFPHGENADSDAAYKRLRELSAQFSDLPLSEMLRRIGQALTGAGEETNANLFILGIAV